MTWKPRYLLLAIAGLFVLGFFVNVVNNEAEPVNTLIQWLIVGVCIAGFAFMQREDRERAALLRFMHENVAAIRAGEASYRGFTLTYATRVRTCEIVLSFLVVSLTVPSRLIIVGGPRHRSVQVACSLITFVFGWWGLPWGPLWTIKAITNNLRGKPEVTVGELLEGGSRAALPLASARG